MYAARIIRRKSHRSRKNFRKVLRRIARHANPFIFQFEYEPIMMRHTIWHIIIDAIVFFSFFIIMEYVMPIIRSAYNSFQLVHNYDKMSIETDRGAKPDDIYLCYNKLSLKEQKNIYFSCVNTDHTPFCLINHQYIRNQ